MFGIGFTTKLKKLNANLEVIITANKTKIADMATYHQKQIAIVRGENLVLTSRLLEKEDIICTLNNKITVLTRANEILSEQWKPVKYEMEVTKIDSGHSVLKIGKIAKKISPKKQAYYDRGKIKKADEAERIDRVAKFQTPVMITQGAGIKTKTPKPKKK